MTVWLNDSISTCLKRIKFCGPKGPPDIDRHQKASSSRGVYYGISKRCRTYWQVVNTNMSKKKSINNTSRGLCSTSYMAQNNLLFTPSLILTSRRIETSCWYNNNNTVQVFYPNGVLSATVPKRSVQAL